MAVMFWLALSQGFLPASSILKFHFVSSTRDSIFLLFLPQESTLLLSDVSSCYVVLHMWPQPQRLPNKLETTFAEVSISPERSSSVTKDTDVHLTADCGSLLPLHMYFFFQRLVLTGTEASADILAWTRDIT